VRFWCLAPDIDPEVLRAGLRMISMHGVPARHGPVIISDH